MTYLPTYLPTSPTYEHNQSTLAPILSNDCKSNLIAIHPHCGELDEEAVNHPTLATQ